VSNRSSTTVLALLFLVLELATSATAQSTTKNRQTATTPTAPAYRESPQGFFTIPDHAQWFTTTFGDSEGPRLDAKYTSTTEPPWQTLRQRVTWSLAQDKTIVPIEIFLCPQGIPQPSQSLIEHMRIAIPLYHVSSMDCSGDGTLYPLGDFVYANGGFRYIDRKVMHALSTVPPLRVRIAPEIQNKQLVNYVQPRCPDDVDIGGTVKLHILVGKDTEADVVFQLPPPK
jgi:hypothetical protein